MFYILQECIGSKTLNKIGKFVFLLRTRSFLGYFISYVKVYSRNLFFTE